METMLVAQSMIIDVFHTAIDFLIISSYFLFSISRNIIYYLLARAVSLFLSYKVQFIIVYRNLFLSQSKKLRFMAIARK